MAAATMVVVLEEEEEDEGEREKREGWILLYSRFLSILSRSCT